MRTHRLAPMLRIELAYWLLAAFLLAAGLLNLRERRWRTAAFWLLLAVLFGGGDAVLKAKAAGLAWPSQWAGAAVIALALLAPGVGKHHPPMVPEAARETSARRLGHWLFAPALLIPLVTVLITVFGGYLYLGGRSLFDPSSRTLLGLTIAAVLAAIAATRLGRVPGYVALTEGRRLLDTLGWAALMPLVLAALGVVLTASGVGRDIAEFAGRFIPIDNRLACVLAYGLGMALFTVIMGNAFAAFPVLTAGIGLPLLVAHHGANPAIVGSLGMLCGYCGTLLTPMAANFNIVPVALLELDDDWAVIRAQLPTACALLAFNLAAMYVLTGTRA
jgi:uncharacterized membrane protein